MALTPHAYDDGSGRSAAVALASLRRVIAALAAKLGMSAANAATFADVYMRATLRGVGHHDVHSLCDRLASLRRGHLNPDPDIRLQAGHGAAERYDGDNGPGELCSAFATERAAQLADRYGIGLCAVSSSNHFLAAAPYVEKAAEQGYLAIVLSRARPIMGVASSGARILGNSPFGFATATGRGHPLLMDACLAHASVGTLEMMRAEGRSVPPCWGAGETGEPTTDPGVILDRGTSYPIGAHKGFGLALLMETLTGVLAEGALLAELNPRHPGGHGVHSQTAIVIRPDALMPQARFRQRVDALLDGIEAEAPGVRIPGKSSHANRMQAERAGTIMLIGGLVDEINRWAGELGVPPLPVSPAPPRHMSTRREENHEPS